MADDPRHWAYCACGLRLPVKTVMPAAPGAHAVSGFIVCPVCDTLPDPNRPAFKR